MKAASAARQRTLSRRAHLVAAVVLLAYVYGPLEAELQTVVRFVVFPLLATTGLVMWQAPRIRRLLRGRR